MGGSGSVSNGPTTATSDNSKSIADPEEFELESKRVTNKLRSELERLIPEDIGIPLLRYVLRSELDRTKGYVAW